MTSRCSRFATISSLVLAVTLAAPATAQDQPPTLRRPLGTPVLRLAGTPDLTVASVREEGNEIVAEIRNIGNAASAATTVTLYPRGGTPVEQPFVALAAGGTRTVRFAKPAGVPSVQVMIDPANRVAESNETNNRPPNLALGTGTPAPQPAAPIRIGRTRQDPAQPGATGQTAAPGGMTRVPRDPSPGPVGGQMSVPARSRVSEPARGGADEIVPPSAIAAPAVPAQIKLRTGTYKPAAVTLKRGSTRAMLQAMPAVRTLTAAQIRAKPTITLGKTQVDFRPLLNDPKSLINVAAKLRALPQLADVQVESLDAIEVPQGLVIRSFVNYRIKSGGCRDAAKRAQIATTGVRCAAQMSDAQRTAAFANPADPRYVADPAQRAKLLADAKAASDKEQAELAADVAALRADLKDPARRAELAKSLGAAEVAALDAMDDTGLAAEIVNSGETKVEQVAYIPKTDDAEGTQPKPKPEPAKAPKPPADVNVSYPLETHYFLAGFTLGREYNWRERIEKRINRCVVGCAKTYYVEVYAGFKYGFGLRFPIEFDGTYTYKKDGKTGVDEGYMIGNLKPIGGDPQHYQATGLPSYQLFEAKEIVAEVGAHAGFYADLPLIPNFGASFDPHVDFTQYLPGKFKGGQIAPPAPGESLTELLILEQIDLIGGRANFGIAGAKVHPAAKVGITSASLTLAVHDKIKGQSTTLSASGQKIPLQLEQGTRAVNFSVGKPVYNLSFTVEPGLVARLFVDIGLWGNSWDWPIWFPSLALTLPPGGVDFGCHDGTVCTRDFRYSPKGAQSPLFAEHEKWNADFQSRWLPECIDETCSFGIKFVGTGTLAAIKNWIIKSQTTPQPAVKEKAFIDGVKAQAEKDAKTIVGDSLARKAKGTAEAWAQLAQAVWTKQCKDKPCYDEVATLAKQMGPRAAVLAKANPEASQLSVQGMVGKEFGPKFKKAVDDSKTRDAAAKALEEKMKTNPNPFSMKPD